MSTVYKYRFRCVTEDTNVFVWADSEDPSPTLCPNDSAHTVDLGTLTIVDTVASNDVTVLNQGRQREDGVVYSVPKPSSYGAVMCDRDFRINTGIFDPAASLEDLKVNPTTNLEVPWDELELHGIFKLVGGVMVACDDQPDADANATLSVWNYSAKLPSDGSLILYEIRDGILYPDPSIFADPNAPTAAERFGHRAYSVIAPDVPGPYGGSIAVFDGYLGGNARGFVVEALSPQATILDPAGPAGAAGVVLRLYLYYPAATKHSHVLRLVTYRNPGTF